MICLGTTRPSWLEYPSASPTFTITSQIYLRSKSGIGAVVLGQRLPTFLDTRHPWLDSKNASSSFFTAFFHYRKMLEQLLRCKDLRKPTGAQNVCDTGFLSETSGLILCIVCRCLHTYPHYQCAAPCLKGAHRPLVENRCAKQ